MNEILTVLLAGAGGILPALAWLWFWRREDSSNPEPRRLIALAFFAGMLTVAAVIPIQKLAAEYLRSNVDVFIIYMTLNTAIFTAWSIIEEAGKFIAASLTVLRRREDDEPIDPVIYMVATALGFAAAENVLFLLSPLAGESLVQTVMTGNLRFVGATLLHVISSASIGAMIGFAMYRPLKTRILFAGLGLALACFLHALFNYLILNTGEASLLGTFAYVWIGVIALLAILEFIKRIHPRLRGR